MACKQRPREGLYESYDVHCVIGKGAYGTVVKALHRRENKWYAVKMFSGDRLRELLSATISGGSARRMDATAAHLKQEVQILQGLRNPYVCELKEAFFEGYSVSTYLSTRLPGYYPVTPLTSAFTLKVSYSNSRRAGISCHTRLSTTSFVSCFILLDLSCIDMAFSRARGTVLHVPDM